jgi:hypothetical protein
MDQVLRIVQHTPPWVFAVLAVLVVLGAQALRPRTLPIWRLLVVPAVFIIWGVVSVATRSAASPVLAVDWLSTGAAGFAIASLTTRLQGVRIDRAGGRVELPGSAVPLMRNLAIFATKYGLTAAMAVAPALQATLAPWDIGVSGLSAGYFMGWLFRFAIEYRKERQAELMSPTG